MSEANNLAMESHDFATREASNLAKTIGSKFTILQLNLLTQAIRLVTMFILQRRKNV